MNTQRISFKSAQFHSNLDVDYSDLGLTQDELDEILQSRSQLLFKFYLTV